MSNFAAKLEKTKKNMKIISDEAKINQVILLKL